MAIVSVLGIAIILGIGVHVSDRLNYRFHQILAKFERCEFHKIELDLTRGEGKPLDSPFNRVVKDVKSGKMRREHVRAEHVGHQPQFILAYPDRFSVALGQRVNIRYAAGLYGRGKYLVGARVFEAVSHREVLAREFPPGKAPMVLRGCNAYYAGGCRFPDGFEIETDGLEPGPYYLFLTDDAGDQSYPIYFNLRPTRQTLSEYPTLLVFPVTTWHAYNRVGGGSLYGIQGVKNGIFFEYQHSKDRLYSASLKRPLLFDPSGARNWQNYQEALACQERNCPRDDARLNMRRVHIIKRRMDLEDFARRPKIISRIVQPFSESPESTLPFLRLLKSEGYAATTISSEDLHDLPGLLDHARLVVLSGHDEYWSPQMRDTLERYIRRGGSLANFAGNVLWWQIQLRDGDMFQDQEGGQRRAACEKHVPEQFSHTGVLGIHMEPGSESITGVSYRFAGYPISEIGPELKQLFAAELALTKDADGVTIMDSTHPIFDGLDLDEGDSWGHDIQLLSGEVDGLPLDSKGNVDRDFAWHAPKDVRPLASVTTVAANRIWNRNVTKAYYGVVRSAAVVETRPFGPESGLVLSFGSMGYGIAIGFGHPEPIRVFLNAVRYLMNQPTGTAAS
ncbi:MAG: DUF6605 domain-containing protein [Rubricoccaceae bacterium]|nr:DUF6605 domain-containing protein [Rubricoccaceae bacterium]